MTDRDRLKENIRILNAHNLTKKPVLHLSNGRKYEFDVINEIVEDVSLILEKLENGLLIELPCKVGDKVYSFCDVFGGILPYVIQDFKIGFLGKDRPNYWYWEATSHAIETDELLDEIDFDLDDIGKTVFLTKEEAEAKLKELSK